MRLGSANRSLHSGKAQSKTAPDKLPSIDLADGGGFEPPAMPLPFGDALYPLWALLNVIKNAWRCAYFGSYFRHGQFVEASPSRFTTCPGLTFGEIGEII